MKAVVFMAWGTSVSTRCLDPCVEQPTDAYRAFDAREPGWIKMKLEPLQ